MTSTEDTRTDAERLADMEVANVRSELMQWGEELSEEGCSEREIVGCFCAELEERLARAYRVLYERDAS